MAEIFDQIRIIIEEIISALGYPGITFVMLVENLFPPIPSEVVMPFAGFLVVDGRFTLLGIVLAGTLGSVLGALAIYYIGVWSNERLIRRFIRRWGRFFLLSEEDIDRALNVFDRYGEIIIFIGRLIPIIRSLISLPAGMQRMSMPKFLLFTTMGTAIWSAILGYAGVVLGENWEEILEIVDQYERATAAVLIVLVVAFVALRLRQMRRNRMASPSVEADLQQQ
ncbi:MAG: DedA family protein [Chloroflexi bacterium]|nr:DedA family protein [Chloroflexota bacterium]